MNSITFALVTFSIGGIVVWYRLRAAKTKPPQRIDPGPVETKTVQRISAGKIWIVDKGDEYPAGQPFRLSSDPEHIIRYKRECPEGCRSLARYGPMALYGVKVAGLSRPEYSGAVLGLFTGANRRLRLQREPRNEYDKNAIEVIGLWGTSKSGKIGYIPRDIAEELAPLMDNGETVVATIDKIILHRPGEWFGLELSIWR